MKGPVTIGRRTLEQYLFRGPEELFDLENDPEEVHNLAGDKEFETVLRECRTKVEAWQYLTRDVWLFKDGVSVITSQGHQRQGVKLRDRSEVDLKDPGNRDGPYWTPLPSLEDDTSDYILPG